MVWQQRHLLACLATLFLLSLLQQAAGHPAFNPLRRDQADFISNETMAGMFRELATTRNEILLTVVQLKNSSLPMLDLLKNLASGFPVTVA